MRHADRDVLMRHDHGLGHLAVGAGGAGEGFDDRGERMESDGSCRTTLVLRDGGVLERTWLGPDGDEVSKPPTEADPAWVKRVKALDKDIKRDIGVERARVEDLLLEDRYWPIAVWRARYLGHQVTRSFARSSERRQATVRTA